MVDRTRPDPTEEEVAAIAAALQMAWPRPAVAPGPSPPSEPRWRFSGRWWAKPVPAARQRPWR
jgi:hypothetical protein